MAQVTAIWLYGTTGRPHSFSAKAAAGVSQTITLGPQFAERRELRRVAGLDHLRMRAVTAAYTATIEDEVIFCDAGDGAYTVTIPDASALPGKQLWLKKVDSTSNAVTVQSTNTIENAASQSLASQYDLLHLLSDGAEWWLLS